jgi:hypothetical protein
MRRSQDQAPFCAGRKIRSLLAPVARSRAWYFSDIQRISPFAMALPAPLHALVARDGWCVCLTGLQAVSERVLFAAGLPFVHQTRSAIGQVFVGRMPPSPHQQKGGLRTFEWVSGARPRGAPVAGEGTPRTSTELAATAARAGPTDNGSFGSPRMTGLTPWEAKAPCTGPKGFDGAG